MKTTVYGALLAGLLAACGPISNNNNGDLPNVHEAETISVPETWEGDQLIKYGLTVEAQLTLAPCAKLEVEADATIQVQNGGSIVTQGTADCPVTITSANLAPGPGDWRGIEIYGTASSNNQFLYTDIDWGGDDDGAVWLEEGARASFRNVTVGHTGDVGMNFYDGAEIAAFENVAFHDVATRPLAIGANQVGSLASMTVQGAGQNMILVNGTVSTGQSWKNLGVPYEIGFLSIDKVLTLDPGVHWLVDPDMTPEVRDGGALNINGTEASPVVIESAKPAPAAGDWREIDVYATSSSMTWKWAEIRHAGGSDYGALWVEEGATITLQSCTFSDNSTCDVYASGTVNNQSSTYDACIQ